MLLVYIKYFQRQENHAARNKKNHVPLLQIFKVKYVYEVFSPANLTLFFLNSLLHRRAPSSFCLVNFDLVWSKQMAWFYALSRSKLTGRNGDESELLECFQHILWTGKEFRLVLNWQVRRLSGYNSVCTSGKWLWLAIWDREFNTEWIREDFSGASRR